MGLYRDSKSHAEGQQQLIKGTSAVVQKERRSTKDPSGFLMRSSASVSEHVRCHKNGETF